MKGFSITIRVDGNNFLIEEHARVIIKYDDPKLAKLRPEYYMKDEYKDVYFIFDGDCKSILDGDSYNQIFRVNHYRDEQVVVGNCLETDRETWIYDAKQKLIEDVKAKLESYLGYNASFMKREIDILRKKFVSLCKDLI